MGELIRFPIKNKRSILPEDAFSKAVKKNTYPISQIKDDKIKTSLKECIDYFSKISNSISSIKELEKIFDQPINHEDRLKLIQQRIDKMNALIKYSKQTKD
jgi:radical SAM superfamily enzyme